LCSGEYPTRRRATPCRIAEEFTKGDEVEWSSHGAEATGEVEEKITSRIGAAGRAVAASEDDRQYLVRSDKNGREAVHKPGPLRPKDS
jgi:hypothetical protein